jgi:hypothetical protein
MTDLKEFCEKNRLDFDKVQKEIEAIKKAEGISDVAAFNKWKTQNLAELAVRKRGEELTALYLGVEYVPITKYNESPVYRVYFLITDEEEPLIAYIKIDAVLIDDETLKKADKIFKKDPVAFEVWKFPHAYVTKGDTANWIVASRVNGKPEMEVDTETVIPNEAIHGYLSRAAKQVEDFYFDALVDDQTLFNVVFYLQSTGSEIRKLSDKEVVQYSFLDLTDPDSFVKVTLTDWDNDIEPIDNYEHILVIGGYTKQRKDFKNALELRKSDKVPIQLIHCPTIY